MPKINVMTILGYLPQLISMIELLKGSSNGPEKKNSLLKLLRALFAIVDGLDVLDPATEEYISSMIDATVKWMNAKGAMPVTPETHTAEPLVP